MAHIARVARVRGKVTVDVTAQSGMTSRETHLSLDDVTGNPQFMSSRLRVMTRLVAEGGGGQNSVTDVTPTHVKF